MVVIVTITLSLLAKERTPIQERGAFFFLFSKFKDILGRIIWAEFLGAGGAACGGAAASQFFSKYYIFPFFQAPKRLIP